MAHRVNVMLDDDVWRLLQRLPRGERSRVINAALAEWVRSRKRADAAQRMNTYRQRLPEVTTEDLVAWVREDREQRAGSVVTLHDWR